jgi:hypothetical protein
VPYYQPTGGSPWLNQNLAFILPRLYLEIIKKKRYLNVAVTSLV